MPDPIQLSGLIPPIERPGSGETPPKPEATGGKDFRTVLLNSLEEVNRLQTEADQGVQQLLSGETTNVAEVFHAANKAGIAFDLLMEVRNKLTDAYREIQQMRI